MKSATQLVLKVEKQVIIVANYAQQLQVYNICQFEFQVRDRNNDRELDHLKKECTFGKF